ncbi:MAG: formate/nitrite transporter family protein [bacterium]|nr:formate/nitrite transporter family protein [bacterium]MDY4100326.1 formate/nitrite transporter family protein [Lachnospiraceae bacterium]
MNQKLTFFSRAFLAGIMIGIGDVINAMCENRVVGALLFGLGLLCILHNGFYLYTGKIGIVWIAPDKKKEILNLFVGIICNIIGVMLVVKLYMIANTDFAEKMAKTAQTLSSQSAASCFLGAIFCGMLMTVATVSCRRENMVAETVITLFCVMVFILAGFKHCIANASMLLFLDCNYVNYLAMIAGNTVGSLCYGYLFGRARENG